MSTQVVGKHHIHESASSRAIGLFRWLSLLFHLLFQIVIERSRNDAFCIPSISSVKWLPVSNHTNSLTKADLTTGVEHALAFDIWRKTRSKKFAPTLTRDAQWRLCATRHFRCRLCDRVPFGEGPTLAMLACAQKSRMAIPYALLRRWKKWMRFPLLRILVAGPHCIARNRGRCYTPKARWNLCYRCDVARCSMGLKFRCPCKLNKASALRRNRLLAMDFA